MGNVVEVVPVMVPASQLSVVVGAVNGYEHWAKMFGKTGATGGVLSTTVTLNEQVAEFKLKSFTVPVTVVVPTGNVLPGA